MPTTITRRRRPHDEDDAPSVSRYRDEDDGVEEDEDPAPRRRRSAPVAEEAPRSRRRVQDDEEDEAPPPRRRRAVVEAEEEEDPPPRRRRVAVADDDEDDREPAPRRRRRPSAEDEDEPPPPRRRREVAEDPEEEEEPQPTRRSALSGFKRYKQFRQEHSNFPTRLKLEDEYVVVKFLDDEPFATWGQHWIGGRPWTCLEVECPLCDKTGDNPRPLGAFNVVVISPKDKSKGIEQVSGLQVLEAGPVLMTVLDKKATAGTGPLTRDYYALNQTGEKGRDGKRKKTNYEVTPIKERDLYEDWDIEPLTDEEFEAFEDKAYEEEKYVRRTPKKELRELARNLDADED